MLRAEHVEQLKELKKLDERKQTKVIDLLLKKLFHVIKEARTGLDSAGYHPGVSIIPQDEATREVLMMLLKSVALCSELLIKFPDITQTAYAANSEWPALYSWAFTFAGTASQLLDKSTSILLSLAGQEMNFTERQDDYTNPYRRQPSRKPSTKNSETIEKKKKKKMMMMKKLLHKGPRLSNRLHNEL